MNLDVEVYMSLEERKKQVSKYLGTHTTIEIDRSIGTPHPKHNEILYPINYGYIPGVLGGDQEELDVYLLGVDEIVDTYDVEIIAIVHRFNDVEDKLVGAPVGMTFHKEEIELLINFQEQFYHTHIEVVKEYDFINIKEISETEDRKYYAENIYGDKFLVIEDEKRAKEYYRDLEKRYIDGEDSLKDKQKLLHVIYRNSCITSVYQWSDEI